MIEGSDGAMPLFVNEPEPLVSTTSPGDRLVLKTTAPFVPAAPVWMCAALIGVPAGKFDSVTWKVAVPPVTLPAASFVTSKVIVAVPVPPASAFVIGGFSFDVRRSAVNVGFVVEGAVELEQAADPIASARAATAKCFIVCSFMIKRIFGSG